jgi:hypothetical protein
MNAALVVSGLVRRRADPLNGRMAIFRLIAGC